MATIPSTPRPATVTLRSETRTFVAEAHNLRRQAVSTGAQRFGLSLKYPPLTREEMGPVLGFLAEQRGRAGLFQLVPHTHATPQGLGSAGAAAASINRALWSERLELAPWVLNGIEVASTTTAPDGMNSGQLMRVPSTDAGNWPPVVQYIGSGQLSGTVVASAYLKYGSANRTGLNLYNATKGLDHLATVTWAAGVPTIDYTYGLMPGDYGLVNVGAGWYRLWVRVELLRLNEEASQFYVRVYPRVTQPSTQVGTYIWGVEVADEQTAGSAVLPEYLKTWSTVRTQAAGPRVGYRYNHLAYTEDFSASYWGKGCVLAPSLGPELKGYTLGPDGESMAQAWGTPANNGEYTGCITRSGVVAATQPRYVLSAYIKRHSASRFGLNIYDQGTPTSYSGYFNLDSAGVPTWDVGGADAHGIENVGNGWWRVWIMLDIASRGLTGNTFGVYIYPHAEDDGNPTTTDATYIFGVQLEPADAAGGYHARANESAPAISWSASGAEVYTSGWQAAAGTVLKAGDLVKFDSHSKVYLVTRDVVADAQGTAVLRIEPALIYSLVPNTLVQVENVPFTCAQVGDMLELPIDGSGHYNYELDVIEAW